MKSEFCKGNSEAGNPVILEFPYTFEDKRLISDPV
jgi:hypothetical protein